MTQEENRKILQIGLLLSSERNLRRLLNKILSSVMDISRCDAGTLYLRDGDALRFEVSRNNTLKNYSGEDADPGLPPVPLTRESVCSLSLLDRTTIRADDVRSSTEYDFTGPIKYDAITGYYTKSMLVTPMYSRDGEAIGVLQLINAMDEDGEICPFSEELTLMIESVAAQSALAIQNSLYIEEINDLIHSFVQVMSTAVDDRSPYTGNHTRHMVAYGSKFLDYLEAQAREEGKEPPFDPDRREELLMSVWLHDIGKLVVPLEVMDKANRLLPAQRAAFAHRMEIVRLQSHIDRLSGVITREQEAETAVLTRQAMELVDKVNTVGFVTDEMAEQIRVLRDRPCRLEDGSNTTWLTWDEYDMLSIRKGTLSAEERAVIENHVSATGKLLSQINFSKNLSHVAEWAADHHELLNGSGYPNHLKGDEVPREARIITILDIFEALTAADRPYKKAKTPEESLKIMGFMVDEGKLDPELTSLFARSRCWEGPFDEAGL